MDTEAAKLIVGAICRAAEDGANALSSHAARMETAAEKIAVAIERPEPLRPGPLRAAP